MIIKVEKYTTYSQGESVLILILHRYYKKTGIFAIDTWQTRKNLTAKFNNLATRFK